MSYGTSHDGECPGCGLVISVVDYSTDPPPIPIRVSCDIYRHDDFEPGSRHVDCPDCGYPFDNLDRNPDTGQLERREAA
jgi:predicted RNA-binding Zn-ribbon protein involved in translation (DUF1610 family)